jgi:preprotein translocase subunit SecY
VNLLAALNNAFRIPDLRRKIVFTLTVVVLYRIGSFIPAPGVNIDKVTAVLEQNAALQLLGLFSGGALEKLAVFSLGVMPYITASIIMQLLQGVIPTIEQWSKEGETGQRKITQITRYMTLGIATIEAVGLLTAVFRGTLYTPQGIPVWVTQVLVVLALVSGTALIMWLAELITQRGIGNGMSLLIFVSIVARFPQAAWAGLRVGQWWQTALMLVITFFVIMAVVTMERAQRRVPVQYAKRVVGRRVYGGTGTYIPFKINGANVVPIIFASAILFFPSQIATLTGSQWLLNLANAMVQSWVYFVLDFALIVFFTYFYTAIVFNPIDLADNLRKNGGFIPGVRPGGATVRYIENVLNRLTLPGAIFLGLIAIGPSLLFRITNVQLLQFFGGTSILIMVGVALETMTQLESQLKMRHYDGFFKAK